MPQKEKKWITLKEASKVSGYAPDYIGELIRKGKIEGKQIYFNVAWVTTEEAILEYKERQKKREEKNLTKNEKFLDFLNEIKQKFLLQLEVLKLFFKTFKIILPLFIVLIILLSLFFFYIFSLSFEKKEKILPTQESLEENFKILKF